MLTSNYQQWKLGSIIKNSQVAIVIYHYGATGKVLRRGGENIMGNKKLPQDFSRGSPVGGGELWLAYFVSFTVHL